MEQLKTGKNFIFLSKKNVGNFFIEIDKAIEPF